MLFSRFCRRYTLPHYTWHPCRPPPPPLAACSLASMITQGAISPGGVCFLPRGRGSEEGAGLYVKDWWRGWPPLTRIRVRIGGWEDGSTPPTHHPSFRDLHPSLGGGKPAGRRPPSSVPSFETAANGLPSRHPCCIRHAVLGGGGGAGGRGPGSVVGFGPVDGRVGLCTTPGPFRGVGKRRKDRKKGTLHHLGPSGKKGGGTPN